MVPGYLRFDSTRAASITAAVPDASSLAPGASLTAFIGSLTRLSMWPVMITTSLGRAVPRWMATALHTLVGVGTRRPVTVSQVCSVSRPKLFISASAQRTAAPIPRLESVCDESVWRVPKPTNLATMRRNRSWVTSRAASATSASGGAGGGVASTAEPIIARGSKANRRMSVPPRAAPTGICRRPGLGERRSQTPISGRFLMLRDIDHFIGGSAFASEDRAESRSADVFDPNQGAVQARVRLGTAADLERAMEAARAAQPAWAATNPQRRARVMFNYKALVEARMDELAQILSSEHGKVIADAKGDIQRGLEVIEFACGIPHALKGEYTVGAGPGIDVYSMRQPLGIVAGITPFNFPAMIPMWMFGVAIACGNAFILKPSERDPTVPVKLAELMKEAGLPDGILNVVHGDKEMVDAILDHEEIRAVSFVGSSDIAHYIYSRGTANGKRVQA